MKRKLLQTDFDEYAKRRKLNTDKQILFNLGVEKKPSTALELIGKAHDDQRYDLKKAFLKGAASKGWMKIGLDFLAGEKKEKTKKSLFKIFILQLVSYDYIPRVKGYVEKTHASIKKRYMLRQIFLTALARNNKTKTADKFLKNIANRNTRFILRKYFISELVGSGRINSAKQFVLGLQTVDKDKKNCFSFYIRLTRAFTAHKLFDDAKELILKHSSKKQSRLVEAFLTIANPDLENYTANLQLMVQINDEALNALIGKKIFESCPDMNVDKMQKWAKKINAIMEKYKVDFAYAKQISELSEGNRYWIFAKHSLFSQKSLPVEIGNKIMGYLLEQSEDDTKKIVQAIENRHRRL